MPNIEYHASNNGYNWMTRERAYPFTQDLISMLLCATFILLRAGEQHMQRMEIIISFALYGCYHDIMISKILFIFYDFHITATASNI